MTKKRVQARQIDERATSGAIDFDAALEAYLEGSDPEELLQAAGKVIDCHLSLPPEHAAHVSALTAEPIEIETRACDLAVVWDYARTGRKALVIFARRSERRLRLLSFASNWTY